MMALSSSGLYKSTANHHIKIWAAAALLVFVWFVVRLQSHHASSTPQAVLLGGQFKSGAPVADRVNISPGQYLDEKAATEFCQKYRLNAFPKYRNPKRKIYDLLLINTELEWLQIRLGQMAPYVDYFVIMESPVTFTGHEKPLYVQDGWANFSTYHHKMIRHTLDLTEAPQFADAWAREKYNRNAMFFQVFPFLTGDQAPFADYVLFVSDVDEIPKPDIVKVFRNCDVAQTTNLHAQFFYYSFQWLGREAWPHPQATLYAGPHNTTLPDDVRYGRNPGDLYNSAWHCSYCLSTIGELQRKIASFSHAELNREEFTNPDKILHRVRNGIDMYERADVLFDRIEHNYDVPEYVKMHADRYMYMLDRDPPNANFKDYEVKPEALGG